MKPFSHPLHPLFQQSNVGCETWWNTVKKLGNPLVTVQTNNKTSCTFVWRKPKHEECCFVYIDVYSQSPSIYQKWNRFSHIAGTDVYFFEIELPVAWAGSYVVVTASEEAPQTNCAATRRSWWQTQLKHNAQIDSLSHQQFYSGHLARYINQVQLEKTKQLPTTFCPITKTFQWSSVLCQQDYLVDVFISGQAVQKTLPLVIFLDGQIWSRELSIFPEIQHLTDSNKIRPAVYVFVHSLNSQQRRQDYGCHDAFSQALVHELIETLLEEYSYISKTDITLCGQSLGGLCALHSALLFPKVFTSLILQSGSYWWSDFSNSALGRNHTGNFLELLNLSHPLPKTTQIYISAGTYETDMRDDAHQLYQQLQSFNQVSFRTFSGGHDAVNWRADLLKALQKILSL
ncbi:enterochelin esterase [Acinetobacter sp. AOR15_HL]|uniref:enterochelin esterase n=1 Tax=unclassified Acinetobacter TaxID=196816 RepID=UPI0022EABF5A|nr:MULTISPECIES: enterochelin esterase [unclassified Acinetobacter]MDA3557799.1 enterochelin esterase [Acinetobacter sp. AOR15_HL]MDA3570858.1 enterochelin esterase [Acinetobacter sp. AOR14_HL]